MYCKNCGKEIEDTTKFCPHCGSPAKGAPQPQPQQPVIHVVNQNTNVNGYGYAHKSKWVAFFLCLFLGFIGAHRFYVGKPISGIIWLFTLGLGGIGVLVDLILILIGAFRDSAGQVLV